MPARWTADGMEEYHRRVLSERDGFLRRLAEPVRTRQRVLRDLLSANADTRFGREHGFEHVRDRCDFQKAVPIRTYEGLAPWIERAAGGERNVLTADDPVVFFMSSGSTGDSKKIPITREFMRTGFFPPFYAAWANVADYFTDVLADDNSTLNLKFDPVSRTATTASGRPHLGASQVDFGAAFGEPLAAEPGTGAVWGELPVLVGDTDYLAKTYMRLRMAVEHDVRCVIGINPAMVAAVPYQLEQWWPYIVKELRDGTLGGRPYGSPNPHRATELERLANRFGTLLPAHVWPHFRLLFCWTTGLASLYLPNLAASFGPEVTVLPAPVAASEGFVAVGVDRHPTACSPALGAAFHEFVNADDDLRADSPTMSFEELEVGREYHVVLSHIGGLYRYALGDVVRVVERLHGMPRVCYAGRNTMSDVAGERLRESHIVRALRTALDSGGLAARNATCRVVKPEGSDVARYEFAVAPQQALSVAEIMALTGAVDDALRAGSGGYEAARAAGKLGEPVLHVLTADAFARDWQARVESGIRPAQVKDRVFQRDDQAWQRLLSCAVPLRPPGIHLWARKTRLQGFDAVARTSLLTTALRIRESARPDRLYNDPYAVALAGDVGIGLFDEVAQLAAKNRNTAAADDRRLPDTLDYNAIRTRFIDDWLAATLAPGGVDQVVIAAAGMDTRAYRLDWPHRVDVYELDRPAVLQAKQAALSGYEPAKNVRRYPVPSDLVAADWTADLTAAGLDPGRRAVWVLEGVFYYLTPAETRSVLADISRFAVAGSPLICDLVNEVALTAPSTQALLKLFASWGSPWLSGTDEPEALFAEYGFTVTATQPGEPGANYGRWKDSVRDRDVPGVPRVFYVHGTRDRAMRMPVVDAPAYRPSPVVDEDARWSAS